MKRLILLLMALIVLVPVSRAEDSPFEDLAITSDTIIRLDSGPREISNGFVVSPNAKIVGVINGYLSGYSVVFYDLKTGACLRAFSADDTMRWTPLSRHNEREV